tara:strand:+ start:553 stop:660 length:108 start_codon:yes stop_codon:yes gene_type:complete
MMNGEGRPLRKEHKKVRSEWVRREDGEKEDCSGDI